MRCAECKEDPDLMVIVPTHKGSGVVCYPCAVKLGLYCEVHQKPHSGFVDGTHTCLQCVDDLVPKHEKTAAAALREVRNFLDEEEGFELDDWLALVQNLTTLPEETCFARAVLAKALRTGTTFDDVIAEIRRQGSFISVMPLALF